MNEIANKQASYDIMPIIMNVGTKLTASIYIFECYCELLSSNWHWLTGSSCRSGDEFSTKQEWMKGESIIHLHKSNQKQLQEPLNQPHFCLVCATKTQPNYPCTCQCIKSDEMETMDFIRPHPTSPATTPSFFPAKAESTKRATFP